MILNQHLRKMPLPAFFRANETFLALAFCAVLPRRRFSAVIFFNAASKRSCSRESRAPKNHFLAMLLLCYQPHALISQGFHQRNSRAFSLLLAQEPVTADVGKGKWERWLGAREV